MGRRPSFASPNVTLPRGVCVCVCPVLPGKAERGHRIVISKDSFHPKCSLSIGVCLWEHMY